MKVISLLFLLASCAHDPILVDPIKGPLKQRNESFRACYHESEQYGGRFSKPTGEMTVHFTVTKEGKVRNEKITKNSFPKDPNFAACLLDQIRKVPFGEQENETIVDHTIDFLLVEE
jgi:hypothetical protein